MFIVPKGVEHKPYAEKEVQLMLIEPGGVKNTGFFCPRIAITTGLVASVGLEENTSNAIELYPNPASDKLRITAKDELIHSIIIYAANGAEVYSMEKVDQNSIELNNLNLDSGIYHCTIELDSQKITKRIVIK